MSRSDREDMGTGPVEVTGVGLTELAVEVVSEGCEVVVDDVDVIG